MSKLSELNKAFDALKKRLENENITLQEISINTGVDEKMLAIFLDNSNNVVNDLSRLFTFMRIGINFKEVTFRPFLIQKLSSCQYKITRRIEPKCQMYFDERNGVFLNFSFKHKRSPLNNKIVKQLIVNEMSEKMTEFVKNN